MTETVVVALIAAVPPSLAAVAALVAANRKADKNSAKVDALHDEVRTNHGKRQGEHIEFLVDAVAEIQGNQRLQTARMEQMARSYADHLVADAVSFQEIAEKIEDLKGKAVEQIDRIIESTNNEETP